MTLRTEVLAGPGVVFRFGQVSVWAGPLASPALVHFLDQSARNLGPSARGGQLLADHVAAVLAHHDPEPAAAFVIVGPEGSGEVCLLLHGLVQVWDGTQWLTPRPEIGWLRASVRPPPVLVAGPTGSQPAPGGSQPHLDLEAGVVPGGGFALVDSSLTARPAPASDALPPSGAGFEEADLLGTESFEATPHGGDSESLEAAPHAGEPESFEAPPDRSQPPTMRSTPFEPPALGRPGGMAFPAPDGSSRQAGPPEAGPPDATARLPLPSQGSDPTTLLAVAAPDLTIQLRGNDPAADPRRPPGVIGLLPPPKVPASSPSSGSPGAVRVVRGVRCSRGHFNHSQSPACVRCGRPMDFAARSAVSGPRPPLGVLVVDDGSVYSLERALLLGSRAENDPMVTGGTARALTLIGDRVSDSHAEIRLNEWVVTLVDRGSPGGTHVLVPGADGWTRLARFQQAVLRPGTHVALGSRVITFLSPWPG